MDIERITLHKRIRTRNDFTFCFYFFFLILKTQRWYDGLDISWNNYHDGFCHGVVADFVKWQVDKHRTKNEDDVFFRSTLSRNTCFFILSSMHVYYPGELPSKLSGVRGPLPKTFTLPYWWPDQRLYTLFITVVACTVALNIIYEGRSWLSYR